VSEIEKFGASKANPIIAAVDSKPYWRSQYYEDNKDTFPEYKDQKYKGNRVKDEKFDWQAIYKASSRCLYALNHWSDVKVVCTPTAEADDIIAVASDFYPRKGQRVVNVTSDKDLRQTQRVGVVDIYDPIKKIFIPEMNVERYIRLHIMQGDKGDNILAIRPRLGPKTAEKLYDELDTLLATNPSMRERYQFNEALIDFKHIPVTLRENIVTLLEQEHNLFDGMKLMNAFQKLHLNQLMDKIGRFKLPDTAQSSLFETTKPKINMPSLDGFFGENS
jgi:5'-3' exonuclease